MAFSTTRGRPRTHTDAPDYGTPELRMKRMIHATDEPLDLCLQRQLITPAQHRAGLHLRWLYTLRYGAPVLTSRYRDLEDTAGTPLQDEQWRTLREKEYSAAIELLNHTRRYEPVMRLCIYNEPPCFLNSNLQHRAWNCPELAALLALRHSHLIEGLDLLKKHWKF
jgi:hypothetical protein